MIKIKQKKPRTKPTLKQSRFVDSYIETGNATEAASKVYKVKNRVVAGSIGTENLHKPLIQASIEERVQQAKNMIYTIAMTGEKDEVKVRACQDIIDRHEGKALARTQLSGEITILSEDELLD